jgi:hypothetical protein
VPIEATTKDQPNAKNNPVPIARETHEQAPSGRSETPEAFYQRFVARPEIRALLRRLAKR